MPDFVLGSDAKLYRNTGTYESPTWNEVSNVKDLTLGLKSEKADATTRANAGWKANVKVLRDATIEFEMVWNKGDADFQAFLAAYLGDTVLDLLVLDGPVDEPGSEGLRAECQVFDFSRAENLTDVLRATVEIGPTYSAHAPSWYEVPEESSGE